MKKMIATGLAAGCILGAGAAHAGKVYWSVGINLAPVGTVVSNVPAYYQAEPVHVAPPPPVYVVPPPQVIYRPAPVVYAPPVVYRPVPAVIYATGYHGHAHHHHWRDRDGRRDEYDTRYRDGRWVPADPRRQHHHR